MRFAGPEYVGKRDHERLSVQIEKIKNLMIDGNWRTHQEIANAVDAPHASVSSQMRNLRMKENGGYVVERRPRGDGASALFEYRLLNPDKNKEYWQKEVDRRKKILVEVEARYDTAVDELTEAERELGKFGEPGGN